MSLGLRKRRSEVRILSGALQDSVDRAHLQVLAPGAHDAGSSLGSS
jgi:hypothetical protein